MSKKPVTIELNPMPLDTIRNLFCMDLPKLYQPEFAFDATFTPLQMVVAILKSTGLGTMAEELDAAAKNPKQSDYSIGCITTPIGSCFAYARYKNPNGVHHLAFLSAVIEREASMGGDPVFNISQHSLLTGVETEDAGQRYFAPVANLCLIFLDEDENDQMVEPTNEADFYAALCYMQQSMATCACREEIDIFRNQCWLDPIVTERAYEEFLNLLGVTSFEGIVATYNAHATMAEDLIEQIKAEGNGDALGYPERKYLLN